VIALALLAAAGQAPFAGIPHVRIVRYPVYGRDLAAIGASLAKVEPRDPHDGERVEAVTHWRFAWQWPRLPGGGCRLRAATVRFSAIVRLPRLVGVATLPLELQAHWQRYLGELEAHEAMHVRYAHDHRGEVLAAIRAATCATANAAGQRVLQRLVAHDVAFDRETQHGRATEPALERAADPGPPDAEAPSPDPNRPPQA
jgi:predicted secreted Zn-dependent protease